MAQSGAIALYGWEAHRHSAPPVGAERPLRAPDGMMLKNGARPVRRTTQHVVRWRVRLCRVAPAGTARPRGNVEGWRGSNPCARRMTQRANFANKRCNTVTAFPGDHCNWGLQCGTRFK